MNLPGAADQDLVEAAIFDKIEHGEHGHDEANSDQGIHGKRLQTSMVNDRT
jgi:hypothetical protein